MDPPVPKNPLSQLPIPEIAEIRRLRARFVDQQVENTYCKLRIAGFLRTYLIILGLIILMAAAIAPLDIERLSGGQLHAVLAVRSFFIGGLIILGIIACYRPASLMRIAPATGILATLCTLLITLLYKTDHGSVVGNVTQFAFIGLVFLLLLPNTFTTRLLLTPLILVSTWLVALDSQGVATDAQIFMSGLFVSGVVLMILAVAHREDLMRREQFATLHALIRLSTTDMLTGIANRRAFFHHAEHLLKSAAQQGRAVSVLIFDIDHFKCINDRFGHANGDEALRCFSRTIQALLRPDDHFARIGGEEFSVMLPQTTLNEALAIAEHLRQGVAAIRLQSPQGYIPLTTSIGVAQWQPHETIDQTLARADQALYLAKNSGRNRVIASESTAESCTLPQF